MGNYLKQLVVLTLFALFSFTAFSQTTVTITGNVHNAIDKEKVPAVSVIIKGTSSGTFTDDRGNFRLTTTHSLPVVLVFSSVGFETKEVSVDNASAPVQVEFQPASGLGTEVVVAASRVPERILESPVSIERVGGAAIRNSPAPDYYDIIRTIKGVDVTSSSLTFTSITTRGFNGSGNARFNQFVDGMDNQAPGLNFSVGSIVGLSGLDVDNMELLPGASSALYGSGGMNGTLLIASKDPFKYQGVSAEVKVGGMHLGKNDPVGSSAYYNAAIRWGQKVSEKFAFKLGIQYINAKDWVANDTTNYTGTGTGPNNHTLPGTRSSDPNYNGVNVYGDETSLDISNNSTTPFLAGAAQQLVVAYPSLAPQIVNAYLTDGAKAFPVSRTGYSENQIIDPITKLLKLSGGLYYKFTPSVMLSLTGNYGTGNTVYTGSDRYSLKDLKMGQYKLELKSDRWFIRAYTTQENSGQAFNATVTSQLFNEAWKPSYNPANPGASWYPQYAGAYLLARANGAPTDVANSIARSTADAGRPVAGTTAFTTLFDQVRSKPIPQGGLFVDRTNLYQTEGQYNLTDCIKFAEVIVGAQWREYVLNSQGTLFADSAGRIHTNEYGAYLQISKKLFDDVLKLTASGRYDKNDNFDGRFTPRVSAVVTVAKDNYIRASFQNAYRFPTNQNQWINLNVGNGILIGGLPQLRSYYHFDTNPVFNATTFQPQTFGTFKPESVNAYELGYKGLYNKTILLDAYGYYSRYQNFIGRVSVVQSKSGNPATINPADPNSYQGYSVSTNSANKVSTYGFGVSLDWLLENNFSINVNASSDHIHNPDSTFTTYWNTPDFRFNIGFSNTGFGHQKRFGFSILYRWQDSYYTESDFRQGNVKAFGTVDAEINYKLMDIRSMIKIGATNLLDHYYISQFGNPAIGGMYYVSYAYNIF
ncbi:MAG TPA: TonB-dependent receptor [Puia sp.]|nr:TonB-dependent receptor [Puia sp.]